MGVKRINPKEQFSKWLARYGAWFWGLYMLVLAVLIYLRPEAAMQCFYLALVVTANKALDTIAYTDNSKSEKLFLTMLDKTRMELTIGDSKGKRRETQTETNDRIESEDEPEEMEEPEQEPEDGEEAETDG